MNKILTIYFSASGITAGVARKLSLVTESDLCEIVPVQPYTPSELNWKNPLSRCNREKFGNRDVPCTCDIQDFEAYDTVYVGFPIWYYGAPNVVATFMKQHDWSGKRIHLFATSGGSGMGKTAQKLEPYISGDHTIVSSVLLPANATEADIRKLMNIE